MMYNEYQIQNTCDCGCGILLEIARHTTVSVAGKLYVYNHEPNHDREYQREEDRLEDFKTDHFTYQKDLDDATN